MSADFLNKYGRDDPRMSRNSSGNKSPSRDPRIRTTPTTSAPEWPVQTTTAVPHMAQMPQTHYTIGDGLTTYQHLVPNATMYPAPSPYTAAVYPSYGGYQGYVQPAYPPYHAPYPQPVEPYQPAVVPAPREPYPQGSWAPARLTEQVPGVAAPIASTYVQSSKRHVAPPPLEGISANDKNKEGVAQEMKQQRAEMKKQRDDYERRVTILRRELELLKRQKQELKSDHNSDRDTNNILKENAKLQVEIQNKLKEALNVIEILSGIIGERKHSSKDEENSRGTDNSRDKPSPSASSSTVVGEIASIGGSFNYVHYDPELHWCRICDEFPRTAKDLLTHLHEDEHRNLMQAENIEIPWHKLPPEEEFPYKEGAPKKRVPIKGLQFFVSAPAWYCRLCDTWIGDLHCASQHLKSIAHSQNYTNFVEQNPHWEIEWLKDREKALERVKKTDGTVGENKTGTGFAGIEKKQKAEKRDKKKKKKRRSKKNRKHSSNSSESSSSSSSESSESSAEEDQGDKSKSIRVAMRNKVKLLSGSLEGKWEILGKLVEEKKRLQAEELAAQNVVKEPEQEDRLISQWMTVGDKGTDKDKYLLDSLKDRLKQKQEAEKLRVAAELEEKRKRQREEEAHQKQQKDDQIREQREQYERQQREREQALSSREQVKFRQFRKQNRRSNSRSPPPSLKRRSRSDSSSPERGRHGNYRRNNGRRDSSRSRSRDKSSRKSSGDKKNDSSPSQDTKKPGAANTGPVKKLPFIGRMPLFKNKKIEEAKKQKEVIKEEYEMPRQSRFQPGNLARSFIPQPDVVHYPKLTTYPPIAPPEPPPIPAVSGPPEAPRISVPKAPPAPKIADEKTDENEAAVAVKKADATATTESQQYDMNMYGGYGYDLFGSNPPTAQVYEYTEAEFESQDGPPQPPKLHAPLRLPLLPPPLPPDDPNDDLAMLGISSDDMAAQVF